ncbi:MAG: hypothetical protein HYX71_05425 [Opitutae bacterium]|nr:hypothetical protein [Opitutae bacterium]
MTQHECTNCRPNSNRQPPAKAQNIPFLSAQPQHTGANAGMIAFAAWAEREAGGVNEAGLALGIAPSLPLAH